MPWLHLAYYFSVENKIVLDVEAVIEKNDDIQVHDIEQTEQFLENLDETEIDQILINNGYELEEVKVDQELAFANLPFIIPVVIGVGVRVIGKQVMKTAVKSANKAKSVGGQASKAINLPSYKTIRIDISHIISGHTRNGVRAARSGKKDLFPDHLSEKQIENLVREAYKHAKKIDTQGDRVLVRGNSGDMNIEMWVNTKTKMIETAYPKF